MNPIRITPPPTCPHGAELNEHCEECENMKTYRVDLYAKTEVRVTVEVQAGSTEEARKIAKLTAPISVEAWNVVEGHEVESIEVDQVEEL